MSVLLTQEEWDAKSRRSGFPWCDTCKRSAVYLESFGHRHSTPEHPFGVPTHLDDSGHKVTCDEWWADF